ncbi:MAG: hypothetical protein HOQ28_07690 [Thermoleophilia bacterium]|nr:hypothetical protein [Thermoleophilia bacterium]
MKRLALLGVAALLAASGCGGSKPASDAAELVPPTTLSFVSLQTDLGPLPHVLRLFPFGPAALESVRKGLQLKRSMGPQLDVAIFKGGTISFTQPVDEKRFESALGPGQLHAHIRGWTVFTAKPALLDLVRHHKGKLSELPAYRSATGRLPGDAIVRAYAASGGAGLVRRATGLGGSLPNIPRNAKWVAAALSSSRDEVTLEVHAQGAVAAGSLPSDDLVSKIPAGAVLAVGLGGVGQVPGNARLEGVDLQGIADALGGEAIAYVRAGLPFPEVTLVSRPKDAEQALRDVGRLITRLARPRRPPVPTTVDGVTLQDVALGAVDIYYGTFDGMLVVSDSTDAVGALRSHGDKLKVPGLPDRTNGFLYLDVEHALPAVKAFAKLANQQVPARLEADVKPLKTLVVYGTRDGDVQTIVASLQTR